MTQTKSKVEKRQAAEEKLRAVIFKAKTSSKTSAPSKVIVDPWDNLALEAAEGVIAPPFDFVGLQSIYEQSSELQSNIDAMSTNIPGFGWRLKRLQHTLPNADEEPDELAELQANEEKQNLNAFLTYIDYDDQSFVKLRGRVREDQEVTGNAFIEVIRNIGGVAANWRYVPAFTMRLTLVDPTVIPIVQKQRIVRNGHSVIRVVRKQKRFRRFVQALSNGPFGYGNKSSDEVSPHLVWFKEYGDPRTMDWRTGEFVEEPELLERVYHATEIIHAKNETSRTAYGIPRWIGALVPLLGVRSAEEINFTTFKNNNIPSLAILVAGGSLTEGSIERITEFVESSIQGDDNYSKILVLEAESFEDDMGDTANVRMDIQPLTKEQHTDALFTNYDQRSREKIRQSFRLPPIYVGRSEDYTRSTADVSRRIADEQIFHPERLEEDFFINRFLLQEFETLWFEFVTNTPNITNDEDIVRLISGAERTGAMTPRVGNEMLSDVLGREIPTAQGIDLDVPFSLQMAEAVKNQAMANEPGQQVTALKGLRPEVIKIMQDAIMRQFDVAKTQGVDELEVLEKLIETSEASGISTRALIEILGYGDDD